MAEAKLEVMISAKDEASKKLDQVGKSSEGLSKKMKILGAVMLGTAAAGAAMLVSFVKAAAKEEAGIVKLSVAMKNMGLSYEDNRESLEAWIDAIQQKTSVADDEQRTALSQLIRMTGDLEAAQSKLTLAIDIAAGTGKDLATANQLVMYAMGGNWGMVERYIPALKKVQDEEEKWMLLRQMFAGQAEEFGKTTAGQFATLMNNIGDLKEAMGEALLPTVNKLLEPIKSFVTFMKEHPELTKFAAAAVAIGTALMAVGGAAILASNMIKVHFLPTIIKMATMIWTTVIPALVAKVTALLAVMAAMGPPGWVMLGIATALIAGLAIAGVAALPKAPAAKAFPPPPGGGEYGGGAPTPPPLPPSMQYGGIVPGRIGRPVPIMAHGGERFLGAGGGGFGTLNFYYQPMIGLGSESEMREAADRLREYLRESERRVYTEIT